MSSHALIDTGAYFDGREWHYGIRVLECEKGCGCTLKVPRKNGRLRFETKKRISYEREIQVAIDNGLSERDPDAFANLCRQHIHAHHWASEEWLKITSLR
jgi:uncharacterized protein YjbK